MLSITLDKVQDILYFEKLGYLVIALYSGTVIIADVQLYYGHKNQGQAQIVTQFLDQKVFNETKTILSEVWCSKGILKVKSVAKVQFYKDLKSLVIDETSSVIYSCDSKERTIVAFCLEKLQVLGTFKSANFQIHKLCMDVQLKQLYGVTREGLLLLFDVSSRVPILGFLMPLVKQPQPGSKTYPKQV